MTHDENTDFNNLKFLAQKLSQGCASTFIGAGFSCNATKINSQAPDLPLWQDLGKVFYKHLYHKDMSLDEYADPEINNPMKLSETITKTESRADLNQILKDIFSSSYMYKPSEIHKKLLLLPWQDIFTTNYDCLLEETNRELGNFKYKEVYQKEDLPGPSNHRIIKLHGSLPHYPTLIVTESDYEQYPKKHDAFVTTVSNALMCNVFCLIGFSGTDPNFIKWVEWVHNELNSSSQPIYLLTHEDMPDEEIIKLAKQKIRIINVKKLVSDDSTLQESNYSNFDSSTNEKFIKNNYSIPELYNNAIDKLAELVENSKYNSINEQLKITQWPNEELLKKLPSGPELLNCKINDISNINKTLQSIKRSYPQWLVMPYSIRKRLSWQLDGLSFIMRSKNFCLENLDILEFLYLYDWIRESCLIPMFDNTDLPVYERSMSKILSIVKLREDKNKCASILLSMMHIYREDGKKDKWDNIYNNLLSNNFWEIMQEKGEIYHRFNYECCLQAIYSLQFDKVNNLLKKWSVDSNNLEWALRKAGILAENNQSQEAKKLLNKTLSVVRIGLKSAEHNIKLLSLESAISEFIQYLEFSSTLKNSNDRIAEIRKRDGLHREYKCSIPEEEQNFNFLLSTAPHFFQNEEQKYGFDFGTYTKSYRLGDDELTLSAYAFLRFNELVAIPYIISHVTHSSKIAQKAALQVSPFSSHLAVANLIRANSPDNAEKLWTRQQLSLMTVEESDSICETYYSPFSKIIEKSIDSQQHCFIGSPDASNAYRLLAIILSHFCCKCSLKMRDKLLEKVIQFYNKSLDFRSKEMKTLTNRLLNSYSENEVIERVNKINSLPLNDDFDPFSFTETINGSTMPTEILNISSLLKECELETLHKKSAEYRLVLLYESKLLTKSQMSTVEKWFSDHYDTLSNKNLIISFSKSKSPSIHQQIEDTLIEKLQSEITRNSFECNSHYWSNLSWAAECNIFSTKNFTRLLQLIQNVILKTFPYVGRRSNFFNDDKIAKRKLLDLQTTLFWFIVNNPDWNPNEKQSKTIDKIISTLNSKNALEMGFKLIWQLKVQQITEEQVVKNLSSNILQGSSKRKVAFRTLYLLFAASYHKKHILNMNSECQLLQVVSEQIKWCQSNYLFEALNIVENGIILNIKIWDTDTENNLLIGLSNLKDLTKIDVNDSLDKVHEKGTLREISAHLAARMIQHYLKAKNELPQALSDWKLIIEDPNEFSEIRDLKDLYVD